MRNTAPSSLPPVYIASRGRPEGRTMKLLRHAMVPFTVFVEPQDHSAYDAHGYDLWVLPEDDRGLYYARQQILNYARGMRQEWYWLMDDDITGFYEVVNKRCVNTDALGALTHASRMFIREPSVGQAGLEYRQYAWASGAEYKLDSYCDVCTAVRSSVLADYDQRFKLKGDRDFTLQVLSEGYHVMKVTRFAFDAAPNGSNAGGLQDTYRTGVEQEMSGLLARKWPRQASPYTKKDGRPDVRIDWKWFEKQRALRASA